MADNLFQQSPYSLPPLKQPSVDDQFSDAPPPVARTTAPAPEPAPAPAPAQAGPLPDPVPIATQLPPLPGRQKQSAPAPLLVTPTSQNSAPTRDDLIARARQLGVDPDLALSFFTQESSGNWNSRNSPKGAEGGMQVMPDTYRMVMGTAAGRGNAWNNMEAGLRYIAYGQKKLGTTDPQLLAAGYHAGYDHPSLRKGVIPNTNDGMISTRDYARSVAARLGGARTAAQPASLDDQFSDTPPSLADQFSDAPVAAPAVRSGQPAQVAQPTEGLLEAAERKQAVTDARPYLDRLAEETKSGFGDMTRSLNTTRWAFGGVDDAAMADQIAQSLREQQAKKKTTAQKEIDAAYKRVTDAKGAVDTTIAGAQALWASITNPKETSLEIARSAANSLPTLVTGAGGAATGAGVGAGVGALAGGVGAAPGAVTGAILGGRTGMAVGTTATELGAEIQDMVSKRLEAAKLPPTAQNVLAIMSDKGFREAARNQGLAKGLTVAAVDQLFMGLGGKIATAPSKKVAVRELAQQGIDVSTRAARKEALATPAGRAAVKAAKPTVAARVGAGTAAVGVDASGEVIGEAASQQVARGEVDAGDALREGVASLGQSVVQTGVGATIESAKAAGRTVAGAVRQSPAAPSTASGPLGRAAENAAGQGERVTATAPDGQVSGTVAGQTADGIQVMGDDGTVYSFKTGPDGVKITPEAPNTPLTNAVEVAAEGEVGQPQVIRTPNGDGTVSVATWTPQPDGSFTREVTIEREDQAAPESVTPEAAAPAPQAAAPGPQPVVNALTGEIVEPSDPNYQDAVRSAAPPAAAPAKTFAGMTDAELDARLQYLLTQARVNGGWNKPLSDERRAIRVELAAREQKVEPTLVDDQFTDAPPAAVVQATPAQQASNPGFIEGPGGYRIRIDQHKQGSNFLDPTADVGAFTYEVKKGDNDRNPLTMVVNKDGKLVPAKDVLTGNNSNGTAWVPPNKSAADAVRALLEKRAKTAVGSAERKAVDAEIAAAVKGEDSPSAAQSDSAQAAPAQGTKTQAAPAPAAAKKPVGQLTADELSLIIGPIQGPVRADGPNEEISVDDAIMLKKMVIKTIRDGVKSGKSREQIVAQIESLTKGGISNFGMSRINALLESQPAPAVGTADKAAEATQPAPAAPAKPKTASKEDLDRLFGVDAKRQKALDRIAAGKAWFNDGVKAKDFITKNGLKDTHEAIKGKGGRWDIVAKTANVEAPAEARTPTATPQGLSDTGRDAGLEATRVNQESNDVADKRASGQPAGAEAVGQKADGNEATATAVQSDAAPAQEEVAGKPTPVDWKDAKPGDYVGADRYVVKRNIRTKKEAESIAADSGGSIALDGPRTWAVLTQTPPEPQAEPSPLVKAMNDLADVRARIEQQGQVVDDRLLQRERQLRALVKELEADGRNDEASAKRSEWWDKTLNSFGRRMVLEAAGVSRPDRVQWERLDAATQDKLWENRAAAEQQAPAAAPAPVVSANKIFTEDAAAKARARLKSKLSQLNSGIDPETMMDGITLAGYHIEKGARTFAAYSQAMLADLGEAVKPYLKSWYMGVKYDPRGASLEGMSSAAEVEAADVDAIAIEANNPTEADAKGNDNGSQELGQSGPRELAGEQPDAVQGAATDGQAGPSAQAGGRADARGDERAGGAGDQQPGRLGNDAGEVSTLASRKRAGRGGEPGSSPVPRGKRAAKPDSASAERGGQRELEPTDGTRAQDRADGFTITDADAIGEGGAKTKYKQNVAAIRLLKQLTAENRQATRAEQAVLAKYVGWGGIPQAFYRDNNEVSKGWEKEAAELKELLTEDELAAAASSTRNAHYTSPEIVQAVWDAAKHFGFQGGRVLEPSVGVGNFFGLMPGALRGASQLTGVELDRITGGIAKQLYPAANIAAPVGFQDFSAPDGYFDLAIGNPPFGREGIYDANRRKISGFSIHNYFFAKSIDTVKPNGVLAMVVTNRLLDSVGDKARAYIADRSEFLGAIRLPNDAFLKNAGTAVTTDIIFLRKLKDGEQPTGQRWMDVKQITDTNGKTVPLNEYFVRNPEMMLGDFGAYGSMYSPEDAALVARPGQDTPALLREAMGKLPSGFMDGPTAAPVLETIEPANDISRVKVGSVFKQGDQIFERREDMLGKQQAAPVTFANDKAKARVTGMIEVRDALVAVRGLQLTEGVSDKALEDARAGLNKAYDTFVRAHGPLNTDANKRLMHDDPTWPQIAALEDGFDKGISADVAKKTGEKARPPSARKAAIFTKRTQSPYKAPTSASSAKDALVASLAERGRVDLDFMANLYGKTPEAISAELGDLIFKTPAGAWESRDQYLSGNVKKKLAQALEAAKTDPAFKANVDALRAVQPADIEAVDIDVKTGAHWVPTDAMEDFLRHITESSSVKAVYNPVNASWTLTADRPATSAATQYSTDRARLTAVLEAAANGKQITVYDQNYDGSRTLNEAATTAANEKVERVKAEWKNWIWADDARRERLARIYNDTFNTDVPRDYDGSHLTFPGKVGDEIIQLRPHQANAVWRMVQSDTTLLDHVVGAGKTFTMIAGIMEMRRMGLAKKPMLVVPNHLVGQWAEDFMKLYPGANILAATKKDFEKDNRKRLFARIATGDWDAVIVAHSSFGKVEVEPEFQEAFIKQQIADMDTSIAAMRAAEGKGSRNVKQIEKQKASLEEKLKKLFDTGSKDDNLYFNELGVDAVLLDEAHEFKNLGFSTGMQRVAGLGNPSGSNKAADMFMKVQSVLKRTGGRNIVFATGTPISNTMAEMYTMQRYLDYATIKAQGIAHFDAWAKTFGEVVTDWELSPSGQYKMNSRFAKFVNMPELMQRYGSFADVINRDDINRQLAAQGKKLPVPKVKGGKPQNIVVERSSDQADYIGVPRVDENGVETYPAGSLIHRSENLPKKAEKGADNMLKIMSDARKAALDMRLIDPSYPDNPASKVNVAAGNIKAIYDRTAKDKGTQLVFIDLSTPKGAKTKEAAALRELVRQAEEGDDAAQEKLDAMSPDELMALEGNFSVYDDLKGKLIAQGIPENEIAFIHDAGTELQKDELFAKVRSGRVRVLFGSTAKMGAGMNVQERLVALHHMDAPWRPSDLEQREGRIIRQGNKLYEADPDNFEVEINRYATKQTLDSRMWQTIEAKARFIEQVRKGAGTEREVEDVAGEAANSAEMKAASSGNPLILEEMSLRQAIRKLENQGAEHSREQYRVRDRMRMLETSAQRGDTEAATMEADAPKAPAKFVVKIGNQTFDKHGEAGEAILKAVDDMLAKGQDTREIGTYGGFTLTIDDTSLASNKQAVLTLKGQGEYQVEANPGMAATGLGLRLQNTVKGLAEAAKNMRAQAERARADIPKLQAQIKPWGQEQELAESKARHAAIIEQLRPKKKAEAKPEGEAPAMSRSSLEPVFAALEGRGLVRKRALDGLAARPDADAIRYIDDNFWDILGDLEESGKVDIKC